MNSKLNALFLSSCLASSLPVLPVMAAPAATISSAKPKLSYFDLGVKQLQDFQPDRAIRYFSRALLASKSPSKVFKSMIFLMIGRAFQADENERAAVQALTIAHALNPNDQTTTAYLADGLVRLGRRDQAAHYFEMLKQEKTKTRATLEVLTIEALKTSDYETAKDYLETALKAPGAAHDAHLRLIYARLLSKTGFSELASAQFKLAAKSVDSPYLKNMLEATAQRIDGKSQRQIELIEAAGKILPNDPGWHLELAEHLISTGNKKDATTHFNQAMTGRLSSRAYLRASGFLRNEKRFDNAIRVANELIRLKPWSAESYQSLGTIYAAQKDYQKAAVELTKAVALDKYNEGVYTDLARVYAEQAQYEKARDVYKQALEYNPKSLPMLRRLGDVEARLKNDDAARQCYEKIIAQVPNLAGVNILVQNEVAVAHAKLGTRFYTQHQIDKALESAKLFNKLKFEPTLPPLLTLVHLRPGRLAPARTAPEQEFQNHIMLADMLREGKRLDDCIAEYHKAEALNSDDIDVHSFLLNVLDEKGDLLETAKEDVILSSKLVNRVPAEVKKMTDKKPEKQTPEISEPQATDSPSAATQ